MSVAKALLLRVIYVAVLLASLLLGILAAFSSSETKLSTWAERALFTGVLVLTITLSISISTLYEECANTIRSHILAQPHTVEQTNGIIQMASPTVSARLIIKSGSRISCYFRKMRRRTCQGPQKKETENNMDKRKLPAMSILWILALLISSQFSRVGVALLGLTFDVESDTTFYPNSNVRVTNFDMIGLISDQELQRRTAQSYGESYINLFQLPPSPLALRGLPQISSVPASYLMQFSEWDSDEKLQIGRFANRTSIVNASCVDHVGFEARDGDGGCSLQMPDANATESLYAPECRADRTTFWFANGACGSRCAVVHVFRPALPTTESATIGAYSCEVRVGEVTGINAEKDMYQISDVMASIFASAIALSNKRTSDRTPGTTWWTTIPLRSPVAPFVLSENTTDPRAYGIADIESTADKDWVALLLARFTTAAISFMDGANPRTDGTGLQGITATRMTVNWPFALILYGLIGGTALLVSGLVYMKSRSYVPVPKTPFGIGVASHSTIRLTDQPDVGAEDEQSSTIGDKQHHVKICFREGRFGIA